MKKSVTLFLVAILLTSACSGPDVGTKLAGSRLAGDGILAIEQKVQGKTGKSYENIINLLNNVD